MILLTENTYQRTRLPFSKKKKLSDFPITSRINYSGIKDLKNTDARYIIKTNIRHEHKNATYLFSPRDYESIVQQEIYKFEFCGLTKNDVVAVIGFSLDHTILMSQAVLRMGSKFITLDGEEHTIFEDMVKYKVSVVVSLSRIIEKFLLYLSENKISVRMKSIIVSGERTSNFSEFSDKVLAITGAKAIDYIGSTELASFAILCPMHKYFHLLDKDLIVEIIDPETKKHDVYGEMIITTVSRRDNPLIRFNTHDLVRMEKAQKCRCKVQNKWVFSGIIKRTDNAVRINRDLVDKHELYSRISWSIFHQNSIDGVVWNFFPRINPIVLLGRNKDREDELIILLDGALRYFLYRRRKPIMHAVKEIADVRMKVIMTRPFKLMNYKESTFMDVRYMPSQEIPRSISLLDANFFGLIKQE